MKYLAYIKNKENKKKIFNYLHANDNNVKFEKSVWNIMEDYTFNKIYIDELSSLGNTMYQIITKILLIVKSKENKTILFIKENEEVPRFSESLSSRLLEKIAELEKNNINQRLEKSKIKIRKKLEKSNSIKIGRKRKSVFDKHKTKIFKDLEDGFSKVTILKKLKNIDNNLEDKTIQSLIAFIQKEKKIQEEKKLENKNKATKKITKFIDDQTAKREIY
uniref:hypothetical protein n=1 Tax=Aliarcobacter sp. TaxID=2321116 RepID=UPI004047C058